MQNQPGQKELAKQTLALYWQHAWRYKQYVIGLLLLVPVSTFVFQFLPPLIIARILEKISQSRFEPNNLWASFGVDLLLYAAVIIIGGTVLWRLVIIVLWKLEMRVQRDIHQRIFNHLLTQSPTFHANRFGGSLVSQANKFTNAYVRIADTMLFQVISLILAFAFAAAVLWQRAPQLVLMIIGYSVVFIVAAFLATKKIRALHAIEASKSNTQTGYLADAVTNVLAIKSFAGSAYESKRYAKATEATKNATTNVMKASIRKDLLFSSMTGMLSISTLVIATGSVVFFKADVATVFLAVSYTTIITQRLWEFLQNTLRNFNRALGDARDMTEILGLTPGILDPAKPETCRISKGAITFDHMSFSHSESDDGLFEDLNLTIKPGEKIGLVGHSGSGKTSLTKLLLRFNDIDSGQILIDQQNIAAITQDDLRASIAYVPQEPLLFHRTIKENIAYGRPEATDEEIQEAARKAHAHDFIEKLALGYETLVGERGVKLSGGQRQRIAIARAILKNAPILVLDEATSALDSESEKLIQAALWELMKGRTAIVIAHRLSTIQKMDRILVLENGVIVEEGSHKALIGKHGIYSQLWAHQSGGFIEE